MLLQFNEGAKKKIREYFASTRDFSNEMQDIKLQMGSNAGVKLISVLIGVLSFIVFLVSLIGQIVVGEANGFLIFFIVLTFLVSVIAFLVARSSTKKVDSFKNMSNNLVNTAQNYEPMISELFKHAIDKNQIVEYAIEQHALNADEVNVIDPIYISGYYYGDIANITAKYKIGSDSRYRSNSYEYTVLLFSETQLFILSYRINAVLDIFDVKMDEYFYTDIVSISTNSERIVLGKNANGTEISVNSEKFLLTTKGGSVAKCSIIASDVETQQSITAMKHLLREKKTQNA